MTRPASKGHARTQRSNIYDEITTKIIAELEACRLPWLQLWTWVAVFRLHGPKSD